MTTPQQRPHQSRQDYATPEDFMTAIRRRLSITAFAFDFAADRSNHKADRWWGIEDDSLTQQDWAARCTNRWGWLNPPFEQIGPWAAKCVETKRAGGSVAFLVPASVGSNWFRDYVDGRAFVLQLNGRLAFMPDKPTWLYPKDCILALYSQELAPGYAVWTWKGSHEEPASEVVV